MYPGYGPPGAFPPPGYGAPPRHLIPPGAPRGPPAFPGVPSVAYPPNMPPMPPGAVFSAGPGVPLPAPMFGAAASGPARPPGMAVVVSSAAGPSFVTAETKATAEMAASAMLDAMDGGLGGSADAAASDPTLGVPVATPPRELKVFVGGLPAGAIGEDEPSSADASVDDFVAALFCCCGELKSWDRAREPVSKRMLTFARATYVVPESAIAATELLHGMEVELKGKKMALSVKPAKEDLEYIEALRSGRSKTMLKAEDDNLKVPGLLPVPAPPDATPSEEKAEEKFGENIAVQEEGEEGELQIDETGNGGKPEAAAEDDDAEEDADQDPQSSESAQNSVLEKVARKARKRVKKLMRALKEKSWRKWANKRLPEIPKLMDAEEEEKKQERERRLQRVLGVEDLESLGDENARQVTEAALESLSVYGVTQETVQADLNAYVRRLKDNIRARQRKRIDYIEDQVRRLKRDKAEAAKRALEESVTTMENGATGIVAARSAPSGGPEMPGPPARSSPGQSEEPGPTVHDSARRSGVSNLPAWMTRGQSPHNSDAPRNAPSRPGTSLPGFVASSARAEDVGTFPQRKKPRIDLGSSATLGASDAAAGQEPRNSQPEVVLTKEKLRELADSIPAKSEELFKLNVDWDAVHASGALETRIKDWVSRKFSEYLGEADETMTTFVQGALRERGTPETIMTELALVLEEDAEVFVAKLWRMVVFEAKRYRATT